MQIPGRLRTFRAAVTEPEPGRVLVETDLDMGAITTFTVEPGDSGRRSCVTVTTDTKARGGVLEAIESWLTKRLLHPIYIKELKQLAGVTRNQTG